MRINNIFSLKPTELYSLVGYWRRRGCGVDQAGGSLIISQVCECCRERPCTCFGGVI